VNGYGKDLPIASNSDEDGREKNRRVEVWLR
jgi:outer membrane protein OmpA-like peptidoglycan-associated protein